MLDTPFELAVSSCGISPTVKCTTVRETSASLIHGHLSESLLNITDNMQPRGFSWSLIMTRGESLTVGKKISAHVSSTPSVFETVDSVYFL